MNNKQKIYIILAICSLLICMYTTATTYAKYFTQTDQSKEYNIKKWNIKVNKEDIKNNQTLKKQINIELDKSEHIADNQIAPDSTGYFIIELDYNNVDLSFDYNIIIEENNFLKDLIIDKIEINNIPYIPASENNNIISNSVIISNETIDKIQEIKVYVKWNDDIENGATMNDKNDTDISINNDILNLNINITLTQKN